MQSGGAKHRWRLTPRLTQHTIHNHTIKRPKGQLGSGHDRTEIKTIGLKTRVLQPPPLRKIPSLEFPKGYETKLTHMKAKSYIGYILAKVRSDKRAICFSNQSCFSCHLPIAFVMNFQLLDVTP